MGRICEYEGEVPPLFRLQYTSKVMGSHFCYYVMLRKTESWKTEKKDSPAGLEEANFRVVERAMCQGPDLRVGPVKSY